MPYKGLTGPQFKADWNSGKRCVACSHTQRPLVNSDGCQIK
jgi:hypothetical protein